MPLKYNGGFLLRITQDTAKGGMRTQAHGNRFLNELKLKVEQGKKENLSYMCAGFEVVRSTKKR